MTMLYALKTTTLRPLLRRPPPLTKPLHAPKRRQHNNSSSKPNTTPSKTSIQNETPIPVPATIAPIPLWQRLGPLTSAFSAYGRAQRKRPLLTQFITSLIIYFCGDLAAQRIIGEEYDEKRTARALVISAGSSIASYKWFIYLSTTHHLLIPTHPLLTLLLRVTINQIAFTPIFNTYFFGMQSLLSGDTIPQIIERIKLTVPTSFINSCKLWPAVTAFSFTFVRPEYRSLFAGVVAVGWQTYLSFLNRRAEEEQELEIMQGGGKVVEEVEEKKILAVE